MKTNLKKRIIIEIVVLVVLAILIGVSMPWSQEIELELGLLYYSNNPADEADIVVLDPKNAGIALQADGDSGELAVHFVDVGQGDCTVICFPDGKTMVIDGGENNKPTEAAIKTFVDNTLGSGFEYFDYAVLTHPDSDHCGSFDYVLNNYPARVVYRPNVEAVGTKSNPYVDPGKADLTADAVTKDTAAYAASVKAMYQTTDDFTSTVYITNPEAPEQTITGGAGEDAYSFTFYSPLSVRYTGEGQWNNYSPIMILEYRGFKYAMSGDAEEKNLGEFVKKLADAKTDGVTDKYDEFDDNYCVNVIKAGHHGSRNATTPEYLDAITSPSGVGGVFCVISCGEGNSYGHPHKEAVDRYLAAGVPEQNILRTDLIGDITISVRMDEDGEFKLFYGDTASVAPVLVYRKLGGIKLTWPLVAWTVYGLLVIAAVIHVIRSATKSSRK